MDWIHPQADWIRSIFVSLLPLQDFESHTLLRSDAALGAHTSDHASADVKHRKFRQHRIGLDSSASSLDSLNLCTTFAS